MSRSWALLPCLLFLVASGARGQAPSRYLAEMWTTENGLPAHTVTGMGQTESGFLWITTTGGLARFDGERFVVFTARDGSDLPSSRFNGLTVAQGDTLWAVTEQGDLVRQAGGRFSTMGRMLTGGRQSLGVDESGRLYTHIEGRLATVGLPHDSSSRAAGDFARGLGGRLWVRCRGDRLCRASGGRLVATGEPGVLHVVQGPGHAVVVRRDGARWAMTDERGADLGRVEALGKPRLLDSRGVLWSIREDELIAVRIGGGEVPERILLPSPDVSTVLEDREGIVWVGTLNAGLVSVREVPFLVYSAAQGLPGGPAITITQDAEGPVAVMSGNRLWRLPSGREIVPTPRGMSFGVVADAEGTRWWAGERLVGTAASGEQWILEEEAIQVVPAAQQKPRREQRLWVRSADEVVEVAPYASGGPRVLRRIHAPESRSLTLGPDGVLWVPSNYGLVHVTPEATRVYTTADGLPTDFTRAVHIAQNGDVWIGTYGGGLARLRNGEIATLDMRQGLAEDVVSSLFEDASGMFWMGGNQSIHRVRRTDAEAVLDGQAPLAKGVAYSREDGLLNPEGSGWPALQARDGTLWFPTFEGVAMLDPVRALRLEQVSPKVHIEGVRVGDGPVRAGDLLLGARERRFTIEYTAASFRAPERVQFQYRLDGLDPDWVGPVADREATYTNVPPGEHVFHVRARVYGGEWSEEDTVLVTIAPFFWETVWFRLLAGVAAIGLVLLLVRWRVRTLRQRQRELEQTVDARTAALEAEKETVAAQAAELRTLDEAKSRLFANVSHEFRTPLQLILGPLADVEAGRHGPISPEATDQVRLASRNGRRLLALVEQLLALARSDAGQLSVEPIRLDAAAFGARVAEAFRPLAEREDIRFITDLPETTGTFDPVAVETALVNLLANAFSFTPSGGMVMLCLAPPSEDGMLAFQVRDSGPGLAPEDAARVFDRFYQGEPNAARRGTGTGIGLSLVREIAALHGGDVSVESKPGDGATFTLWLPLHHEAPEASGAMSASGTTEVFAALEGSSFRESLGDGQAGPEPLAPEADVPRVLVVDDNADLRALVREHLYDGYHITEAASGDEAVRLAQARVPDAIVSDVMMPGLDGIGMVRMLRTDPETDFVPILLLTARATVADTVDGLGAGADDYLAKPFDARELRARVDALIASRQRLRERWQVSPPEADALPVALASGATSAQREMVTRLVTVIDERLDDETLSVDALAESVGMSRATLYRRLKGATEGSPADLLRDVRLARAAGLLREGAGSVGEVAYGVGFKSVSHFSERFRERYGTSPSRYAVASGATG